MALIYLKMRQIKRGFWKKSIPGFFMGT